MNPLKKGLEQFKPDKKSTEKNPHRGNRMERVFFSGLTILTGMLVGLHLAMNGQLGAQFKELAGSDVRAAAAANGFFWITGALVAIVFFLILGSPSPRALLQQGSPVLFLAGALGASIVFAVTYLIPARTGGAGNGFILLVSGQVIIGLLLSHFGWLGSPVDPLSLKKILGLTLLLAGLYFTIS
ncbi:MAG: DMT family transporter [Spirochaetales bacterium]|nr:DMT family transporter [Spirochaetales bacterium]